MGVFIFLDWCGSGVFLLFWIIRRYGQMRFFRFLQKHKQVQRLMVWVESHGFGPLFILLCFPFTPSAIVNIVAGLSKVSTLQYGLAVVGGKAVMIFTISFVGYDLVSLIHKPVRTVIIGIVIFILWYVGKRLEVRLNRSMKREEGQ
ncbi:VTT domain-containing protein [Peribacillus frigoritolerans]|nr:VTT domain-containing protein [Peribacillus frigoritolerans]